MDASVSCLLSCLMGHKAYRRLMPYPQCNGFKEKRAFWITHLSETSSDSTDEYAPWQGPSLRSRKWICASGLGIVYLYLNRVGSVPQCVSLSLAHTFSLSLSLLLSLALALFLSLYFSSSFYLSLSLPLSLSLSSSLSRSLSLSCSCSAYLPPCLPIYRFLFLFLTLSLSLSIYPFLFL